MKAILSFPGFPRLFHNYVGVLRNDGLDADSSFEQSLAVCSFFGVPVHVQQLGCGPHDRLLMQT